VVGRAVQRVEPHSAVRGRGMGPSGTSVKGACTRVKFLCSTPGTLRRPAAAPTRGASFDDLVGAGEDRWRDGEAERPGGLEIDDQLECGWLLHRQIGWLGTLEDLPDVNADLTPCAGEARSIADQAARCGEI